MIRRQCVIAGRLASRLKQREETFATAIAEAAGPFLEWYEAEFVLVEDSCTLQILSRDSR